MYNNRRLQNSTPWESASEEEIAKGGWYGMEEDGVVRWTSAQDFYIENGVQGIVDREKDEIGKVDQRTELITESLKYLVPEKKELKNLINRIGKDAGLSQSEINQLKIEVDSRGKIVVGGLKNDKKCKAMQKALNNEDGLGSRIKNYQTTEMVLRREDAARQGSRYRTNQDTGEFEKMSGYDYVKAQCNGLDDVSDLEGFDDPLDYALAELFRDKTPSADFSYGNKGVANPAGALEKWSKDLTQTMAAKVAALNEINDIDSNPELEISLDNVSFTITSTGTIEITGRLAESDAANEEAKCILEGMIRDAMLEPSEGGGESLFDTSMTSLLSTHDDAFGERGGKSGVVEFGAGGVKSYVDAPGVKDALSLDMAKGTFGFINDALKDMSVVTAIEDFEVSESGSITYIGNAQGEERENILSALRELQKGMNTITRGEEHAPGVSDALVRTANSMSSLLKEFRSYGSDADKTYQNYVASDEEAFLEHDTHMDFRSRYDYKLAVQNGSYRGGDKFTLGNYTYRPWSTDEEKKQFMIGLGMMKG